MSKSTKRYGKVLYRLTSTVESDPQPSKKLLKQWAELDEFAQKEFGKLYDQLTERQKSELHFNIKDGKYKDQANVQKNPA